MHVIILNGVGSVGKTSTARALQQIARAPFLHVSMDAFIGMMPELMFGHADGMVFEPRDEAGHRIVEVTTGPFMAQAMRGMRHAVRAMAAQGNNLIVDDVMMGKGEAQDYRALLDEFDLHFVGLFAPLTVLEERERARGDRQIGLARFQFDRVHCDVVYDLKIETADTTPLINARMICSKFAIPTREGNGGRAFPERPDPP